MNEEEKKEVENSEKTLGKSELISFAYDIGFSIAIPLVIFVGGGRYFDKKYDTAPMLMIIGLLMSLVFTTVIIYRKTKKIMF